MVVGVPDGTGTATSGPKVITSAPDEHEGRRGRGSDVFVDPAPLRRRGGRAAAPAPPWPPPTGSPGRRRSPSPPTEAVPDGLVFILVAGSDARPDEDLLKTRADSIHLLGVNPATGPGHAPRLPPRQLGRDPRPRPGQDQQRPGAGRARPPGRHRSPPDRPPGRLLRHHRVPGAPADGRRAGRRRRARQPAHERQELRRPVPAGLAPHDRRPGAGLLPQPDRRRPGRPQPLREPGPRHAVGAGQDAGRGGRRRRRRPLDRRDAQARQAQRAADPAARRSGRWPASSTRTGSRTSSPPAGSGSPPASRSCSSPPRRPSCSRTCGPTP